MKKQRRVKIRQRPLFDSNFLSGLFAGFMMKNFLPNFPLEQILNAGNGPVISEVSELDYLELEKQTAIKEERYEDAEKIKLKIQKLKS